MLKMLKNAYKMLLLDFVSSSNLLRPQPEKNHNFFCVRGSIKQTLQTLIKKSFFLTNYCHDI